MTRRKAPSQTAANGPRDAAGRFLPGNPGGPGRPPGRPDLRVLAEAKAEQDGIDLDAAVWDVTRSMIELARGGDVAAAKLILDRLTAPASDVGSIMLQVVTGVPEPEPADEPTTEPAKPAAAAPPQPAPAPPPPIDNGPARIRTPLGEFTVLTGLEDLQPEPPPQPDPFTRSHTDRDPFLR